MRSRFLIPLLAALLAAAQASFLAAQTCVPHLVGADRRGLTWGVERSGDTIFVLSGAALLVYDVSDRWNPQATGSLSLDDVGYGLALDGDVVSVLGARSLRFVDVSDPEHPIARDAIELPFAYYYGGGLAAEADFTYLVTGDGLRVFDTTDPGSVVEVATLPEIRGSEVALRWNRAYVSTCDGLRILDVTDPAHPIETGLLPSVHGGVSISASRNRLAASSNPCGPRHCCTRVRFFDLADPDQPVERSDWWDPGESCPGAAPVLRDGRAYVFTQLGISILDLTDLAHPVELASFPFGDWNYDAAASSSTLFVANVYSSLGIVAVGDPANVRVTAELKTPGESFGALLSGSLGIVGHRHGLRTVDLSDPARPAHLGARRFANEYFGGSMAGYADRAYAVGSRYGARPFDLSDPAHPRAGEPFAWISGRLVQDSGRLYVADNSYPGDLEIWDLADPDRPLLLGEHAEYLYDLAVDGSTLFAAKPGVEGYRVYDVQDPADVRWIGERTGTVGYGPGVVRGDLHLFVSSGGLWVDDVSNRAAPEPLGFLPLPGQWPGERMTAYGSRAFIASAYSGLGGERAVHVVDFSDPRHPQLLAELATPGAPRDVATGAGLLLVADGEAGISLFDTCQPFADGFESGDTSAWSKTAP